MIMMMLVLVVVMMTVLVFMLPLVSPSTLHAASPSRHRSRRQPWWPKYRYEQLAKFPDERLR
jgi:hypothetical protein